MEYVQAQDRPTGILQWIGANLGRLLVSLFVPAVTFVVLSVVCRRPESSGVEGSTIKRTLLLTVVVIVLAVASTSYTPKGTTLPASSMPSHTRTCSPPPRLRR